jgi:hypothetical protein
LERRRTAAFAAPYALAPANGLIPETEATLTMLPPWPACMARMQYFVPRNTPSRFTASTRRHSSSDVSATGLPNGTPALLTRMSSRPWAARRLSIACCQAASSATSRRRDSTLPPAEAISAATA